jgi:hypothetical protein
MVVIIFRKKFYNNSSLPIYTTPLEIGQNLYTHPKILNPFTHVKVGNFSLDVYVSFLQPFLGFHQHENFLVKASIAVCT